MLLSRIVETSRTVGETRSRSKKIEALAAVLSRLPPESIETGVAYLSGELRQGRIGLGPAVLRETRQESASSEASLQLREVDRVFDEIAAVQGKGATAERARLLRGLWRRATHEEQDFLARLILGELRQGALEGIMMEAVARAAGVRADRVRAAAMRSGDLRAVATAVLREGAEALGRFRIELFRPVQPMLAQAADDISGALERLDLAAFEYKLDGARIQVHKSGEDVRIFTRRLNDVTVAAPEVVELIRELPVGELVLDGEVLALDAMGRPRPFQTTMRRFGRRLQVERLREELPLTPFFFDCLLVEGQDLTDRTGRERIEALESSLPPRARMPRLVTADAEQAERFLERALSDGHEGVMAKSLEAVYQAGGRGQTWLKVKPVHTLDLVVLAAEWGSGRRRGWLSNLHLGARDPAEGGYVMLGKTFKGMTDAMLTWQTEKLLELEIARDQWTVYVRPELVVEIAFNDIQASPQYPGGMALRFARVKRHRRDKQAADADTIQTVRAIFEQRTS